MTLWITLAVNSITIGGLLFLLSAGFSLIFGLMRIPNLMHGSYFMLGAYFGAAVAESVTVSGRARWRQRGRCHRVVASSSGSAAARLPGQELAQVLVTLGLSFIVADVCLMIWTGDPMQPAPPDLRGAS